VGLRLRPGYLCGGHAAPRGMLPRDSDASLHATTDQHGGHYAEHGAVREEHQFKGQKARHVNYTDMKELRRQLYCLFGSYGKVIDVVATRIDGMRGQAFVVFRDLQSATSALRALDGFEFYEKPLVLDYARTRSKATIVAEHGEEALLRPDLLFKRADGTSMRGRITYSNAQGSQEKKRPHDDAPAAPSVAPPVAAPESDERPLKTARTEPEPEDSDDDGMYATLTAAMEIGNSDDE